MIGFGFPSLLSSTPEASQDLTVSSSRCIFLLFSSDTAASRIRYWLKPEYCYTYYQQALFGIMSFQYRYELASSREEWLTAPVSCWRSWVTLATNKPYFFYASRSIAKKKSAETVLQETAVASTNLWLSTRSTRDDNVSFAALALLYPKFFLNHMCIRY